MYVCVVLHCHKYFLSIYCIYLIIPMVTTRFAANDWIISAKTSPISILHGSCRCQYITPLKYKVSLKKLTFLIMKATSTESCNCHDQDKPRWQRNHVQFEPSNVGKEIFQDQCELRKVKPRGILPKILYIKQEGIEQVKDRDGHYTMTLPFKLFTSHIMML